MAQIDGSRNEFLLNNTLAGMIAKELDAKDSGEGHPSKPLSAKAGFR